MRPVALLLGGLLAAAEPVTVPLALQEADAAGWVCEASAILDAQGSCRFPFAWADGWLRCQRLGDGVRFDRNGDARIDDADGAATPFGQRAVVDLAGWGGGYRLEFASWDARHLRIQGTCIAIGSFAGTSIVLFDANVDGRFEIGGCDRALHGTLPAGEAGGTAAMGAPLLMPVMALSGRLYRAAIAGPRLQLSAWEGATTRLTVAVADGPNPLGLPAARSAQVKLRHREGLMEVAATTAAMSPLVPGDYIVIEERLDLTDATPERLPYIFSPGTNAIVTLAAGEQRLERRLPERLTLAGCVLQGTELELDPPALVAADGTTYVPVVYGLSSEDCPTDPLSLGFHAGERRSEPFNLAYG